MLRILDLFAGIGGVARGIHRVLREKGVKYEYIAVDIDKVALFIHKKLNPKSKTIVRDAFTFTPEELYAFDFIWASPPCTYYSRFNSIWRRNVEDNRLWEIIRILKYVGRPFIVENVKMPKKKIKIEPTLIVDRHMFWSNILLELVPHKPRPKRFDYMTIEDWYEYHNIPPNVRNILRLIEYKKRRKYLRSMVDSTLIANLFSQVVDRLWGV